MEVAKNTNIAMEGKVNGKENYQNQEGRDSTGENIERKGFLRNGGANPSGHHNTKCVPPKKGHQYFSAQKPTVEEAEEIYRMPLLRLLSRAMQVMKDYWGEKRTIQKSALISIKTGGCPEDCAYCSQSVHYQTEIKVHPYMKVEEVVKKARELVQMGADRICLSAAQREVRTNSDFENVLEMVRRIKAMGVETCCTLGMLTEEQAKMLKEAGLDYYNHNIDTSPSFYPRIITTRKFEDRIRTLENVRKAGIKVCCGIIVGMGESVRDRVEALCVLASMEPPPESVPINALIPIKGTPLGNRKPPSVIEIVRTIATARILMPSSWIRLSAGRIFMSKAEQILCFLAGANSLFLGEKLLTAPNAPPDEDKELLEEIAGAIIQVTTHE